MARRRSGKKIDFMHWTAVQGSAIALASGGTSGTTMLAAQHLPETILRTRGSLLSFVDSTQAPGGLISVAVGFVLVPEGTGTTVLWSPLTDIDAPWWYYSAFVIGYEEMVTDVVEVAGLPIYRETVDSKAMRIVKNQELQMVVETSPIAGSLGTNTAFHGRVLSGT